MKSKIQSVTQELVNSLPKDKKYNILNVRHNWLKRQRKQDKLELQQINRKIYHQRPEVKAKRREYLREYRQRPEVKEKIREYKREYERKRN